MYLEKDIRKFWDNRQERIMISERYAQIENELDEKVNEFKNKLPPDLQNQLRELEELCASKRYESNYIVYQKAFREGIRAFILTYFNT